MNHQRQLLQSNQRHNNMMKKNTKNILVIGASGIVGSQLIQQISESQQRQQHHHHHAHLLSPSSSRRRLKQQHRIVIYGMCRDVTKIDPTTKTCCKATFAGDACNADDIEHALYQSQADLAIMCIGDSDKNRFVRRDAAKTLVKVLSENPKFQHVQVIVVSRQQQQPGQRGHVLSSIRNTFDIKLQHAWKDHKEQEEQFRRKGADDENNSVWDRSIIVKPCMEFNNTADKTNSTCRWYYPTAMGGKNFTNCIQSLHMLPSPIDTTCSAFCKWLVNSVITTGNVLATGQKHLHQHRCHGQTPQQPQRRSSPLSRQFGVGRVTPVTTIPELGTSSSSGRIDGDDDNKIMHHPKPQKKVISVPHLAPPTHTFAYKC